MSREIRFRVWDTDRECWCYWNNLAICPVTPMKNYGDGNNLGMTQNGWVENANFSNYIFQQSVGLLDVNKKEIFEGDIIEIEYRNIAIAISKSESLYKQTGYVAYSNNTCSFRIFLKNSQYPISFGENLRIIGNIFKNKNLIEKYD